MARATEILDLGTYSWVERYSTLGHNVVIVMADPEGDGDVFGPCVEYTLTPAMIHAAFDSHFRKLCCGAEMRAEGYGGGCANDADIVLQVAAYGKVVFG